jgi:hypothetical protein
MKLITISYIQLIINIYSANILLCHDMTLYLPRCQHQHQFLTQLQVQFAEFIEIDPSQHTPQPNMRGSHEKFAYRHSNCMQICSKTAGVIELLYRL